MTCHHDTKLATTDNRRLQAAFAVIAAFMVVEIVGGIMASSLALLADAAHMATDAAALLLAISAQWFASRPADEQRHFGYQRGQVLAAFVNGILLFALLAWIIFEAVQRFFEPADVSWQPMLIVAVIGLVANLAAFRILHPAGNHNINIRGAMLHVVSDLMGSVAAVIAALVIATSGALWIDPLLSLIVAFLIARSAAKLVQETGHILLEGAPADVDTDALKHDIEGLSDTIENIHGIQIWQITPGDLQLVLHARIKASADPQQTLQAIKQRLTSAHGIARSTVQIEIGDCCEVNLEDARSIWTKTRQSKKPALAEGSLA